MRYKGAKTVAITPDYAEVSKLSDIWLHPKQGTDAALAMAMGHVILREFHIDRKTPYFEEYVRRYTDLPMLVKLVKRGEGYVADRYVRASDISGSLGHNNNPEWKTLAIDETSGNLVAPNGSIGFRWNQQEGEDGGKWNIEEKDGSNGATVKLRTSLIDASDEVVPVGFPYFGGISHEHFQHNDAGSDILFRNVPAKRLRLVAGDENGDADEDALVTTVFDLLVANYGIDRSLGGGNVARSFDDNVPYTLAWQESITGVKAADVISVARQFSDNAEKTEGKSMVIIGAAMNHWYHADMNYRGVINMLMLCGCIGKSGGGWAHYVGQEKLRPQTGWLPLAFSLDWHRPPRQMNSASFFYAHTDQWRYERVSVKEILSPTADPEQYQGTLIDFNVRAERMGWLPSRSTTADQSAPGRERRRRRRFGAERLRGERTQGRQSQDVV